MLYPYQKWLKERSVYRGPFTKNIDYVKDLFEKIEKSPFNRYINSTMFEYFCQYVYYRSHWDMSKTFTSVIDASKYKTSATTLDEYLEEQDTINAKQLDIIKSVYNLFDDVIEKYDSHLLHKATKNNFFMWVLSCSEYAHSDYYCY